MVDLEMLLIVLAGCGSVFGALAAYKRDYIRSSLYWNGVCALLWLLVILLRTKS